MYIPPVTALAGAAPCQQALFVARFPRVAMQALFVARFPRVAMPPLGKGAR